MGSGKCRLGFCCFRRGCDRFSWAVAGELLGTLAFGGVLEPLIGISFWTDLLIFLHSFHLLLQATLIDPSCLTGFLASMILKWLVLILYCFP